MNLTEIKDFGKKDNYFYYREGTSDSAILHENFIEANEHTYVFPPDESIESIVDLGANIGAISVRMAMLYPNADILALEPVKENYEILKKNTLNFPKIRAVNAAAGSKVGSARIYQSDDENNHGGFSMGSIGVNPEISEEITVVSLRSFPTKIDLIKIDTEGSEYDIITSLSEEQLRGVKYIVGEMHGVKDYELMAYLRDAGFDLSFKKPMGSRVFSFCAKNTAL